MSAARVLFIVFCSIVISLLAVSWYQGHIKTKLHAWSKIVPDQDTKELEEALAYRKRADFVGATAFIERAISEKPTDDFLLGTASDIYFERAQADPASREHWVEVAVHYSEMALKAKPFDIVNEFNLGESYLSAGMNLQDSQRCTYLQKSLDIFERVRSDEMLKNEWGTIEGQRERMEPYRKVLDRKIKDVRLLTMKCSNV